VKLPLLDGGQDASSEDHITHLTSAQVALGDVVVRQPKFCLLPLIRSNPDALPSAHHPRRRRPRRRCLNPWPCQHDYRC